jgi:hypothetical protein
MNAKHADIPFSSITCYFIPTCDLMHDCTAIIRVTLPRSSPQPPDFAITELQIPISIRSLMGAFDCVRDGVTHTLLHGLDTPPPPRHPAVHSQ